MQRTAFATFLTLALADKICRAEESHVRLIYEREPGAEICQKELDFRSQLTAKLGYDAITTEEGTRVLRVVLAKRGLGFRGTLELSDAARKVLGSRSIASKGTDCHELLSALVVAAAISIDPSSIARAPEPLAAPKATPVPAPPHAASAPTGKTRSVIDPGSRYLSVDAAILLALGTEPGPTAGGTVGLGFGSRPWSAKAEVRFDASASTTTTAIAAPFFPTFSAVSGSLFGGAVVPCYQIALLRGCATLLLGGLSVTGGSTISLTSTARFFAAAGPRFEVALPIGGVAGLFFRAELLANFTRTEAFVDGVSMWRVPPVSGSLGFGGELHLPLKGATP